MSSVVSPKTPCELVRAKRIELAFAVFYTGTLGSSALAPVLYGWLGDAAGPVWAAFAAAVTALAVVPAVLLLSPRLAPSANDAALEPGETHSLSDDFFSLTRAYLRTVNEPEVGCLLVAQEYRRSTLQTQLREVE